MKRVISVLLVCIMFLALVGCDEDSNKHEGKVKTPSSSSVLKGRNYQEVIDEFTQNGFTNIKSEAIEDLITGWITKDGEVEEVSVGGDDDYTSDEWVSADTEVIIKYHTFAKEDSESETKSETMDNSEQEKTTDEILTIDNCEDLETMLSLKDEFDPLIKEFAMKYAGRTIEFDGNTASVTQHGDYKTRFDYLIYAGDYSETNVSGPSFQFSDVNYHDLHLTGDNVPDSFGVGLNIHIVATVKEYDENSGLFQLSPVSINMR